MNLCIAERGDLPRILAIQKEAYLIEAAIYNDFSIPPLRQSLSELESDFGTKVILKAEIDGLIVGSVRLERSGTTCFVGRLIVDPKFQRRGIGTALLLRAETIFHDVSRLELFTGGRSEANLRLYLRHGYRRFKEVAQSPSLTLVYLEKYIVTDRQAPQTILNGVPQSPIS